METSNCVYKFYKSKQVKDFDGFWTDYSWWLCIKPKKEEIEHCFILGDAGCYDPSNEDYDWKCETYKEALEWWEDIDENYFYDEDDILDNDLEDIFNLLMGEE